MRKHLLMTQDATVLGLTVKQCVEGDSTYMAAYTILNHMANSNANQIGVG